MPVTKIGILTQTFENIKDDIKKFKNDKAESKKDEIEIYKFLLGSIELRIRDCEDKLSRIKYLQKYEVKEKDKHYKPRELPLLPYERARIMLRRLKKDKATYDKFCLDNKGKTDKNDFVYIGTTPSDILDIMKDIKFLKNIFNTELKEYKNAYEEIFINGLSLIKYSQKYLDGQKKSAENLCNKIYQKVADQIAINSELLNFKFLYKIKNTKKNQILKDMESELVSEAILNYSTNEKTKEYFEDMTNAYQQLVEIYDQIDDEGNI